MSELDEFDAYIAELSTALGHAAREAPFRGYTTGLLLPIKRKSVEPMAARVDPGRVGAAHQSLHHLVAKADWSDAALLAAVRGSVLPAIEHLGPIEAWIVDDTGIPKKGRHSVGVARQYCGQLGKQENCQVAVSLSVANAAASLPVAWRLYLPREWADDVQRRTKAGVPAELAFHTKPTMALEQIEAALAAGIPRGVVLADAGYGADMKFQARLAWLSSPCEFMHRCLRLPDQGTLGAFPLRQRPIRLQEHCPTRDLHPSRQPSKDPRGIPQTPSPPCASASPSAWLTPCRDVHAACGFGTTMSVYDTV